MNENFYKSVLNNSPMGYAYHKIVCDKDGTPCDYEYLEINSAFEKLTGLKSIDVIDKRVTNIFPAIKNSDFDWIGIFGDIAINGGTNEFEQFFESLKKYFRVKVYSPKKNYFIILFIDSYEESSENKFKSLFENMTSGAGIYEVINDGEFGKDYIVKELNKESLIIEGKTKEEVIGKSLYDLRPNIDEFGLLNDFREVWKTGIPKKIPAKLYTDEKYNSWYENNVFRLSSNEIVAMYNDVIESMQTYKDLKSSRDRFKQYIDKAPYGVFVVDETGNYLEINETVCKLTGYTKKDLLGENKMNLVADEDKEIAFNSFQKVKEKGIDDVIVKYITKNNNIRDFNCRSIKLNNARILGFTEDITEKRVLEKRIIESEEEHRALFNNAGLGIRYFKPDGTVIWFNEVAAKKMDGVPGDFKGKSIFELFAAEDAKEYMKRIDKAIKINQTTEYEDELEFSIGKKWFKSTYNCIYNTDNELLGIQIISQDITDLKQSERSLFESEQKFRLLFEDAPMGYQSLNEKGYLIAVNKAWLGLLGYSRKEVIGKWFGDFLTQEYVEIFKTNFPEFIKKGTCSVIFEVQKKNREKVLVNFNGRISYNEFGNFKQTHCLLQDITTQKNAEKKLIESEKRYRTIFDQAAVGIYNSSLDGRFLNANKKACEMLGYTLKELKKLTFLDITHPNDIEKSKALFTKIKNGETDNLYIEKRYIKKDGRIVYVIISGSMLMDIQDKPLYTVITIQDITEQKLLEEEKRKTDEHLQQQQRLESIGTLAGGVAHEINNPINGIMNYSQLILDSSNTDSETSEYAKEIIHETERVATIVKNLLQFSRNEKQTHSYASIETIIEKTLSLIKTVIRHDQIDLQINIPEGLPKLKCRSQQIQQVIMNLLTNSRDALNLKYKGYHENKQIELRCKTIKKKEKEWIRIIVKDNGDGIPKSVQERLFEPFFTTKERDKGTGLGLSISHSIVKDHHGMLTFETKVGSFTRFYLDLPIDNDWNLDSEAV